MEQSTLLATTENLPLAAPHELGLRLLKLDGDHAIVRVRQPTSELTVQIDIGPCGDMSRPIIEWLLRMMCRYLNIGGQPVGVQLVLRALHEHYNVRSLPCYVSDDGTETILAGGHDDEFFRVVEDVETVPMTGSDLRELQAGVS